ncbi:hypothetical protein BHE74_00009288 [Ensete ventricosum]|nr:hypothetical protein BHE74_00009288 [Ensete ventricosum]
MHCNINQLFFFICNLFLMLLDLLLYIFKRNCNSYGTGLSHLNLPFYLRLESLDEGTYQLSVSPIMSKCVSKLNLCQSPMIIFWPIVPLNNISFKVDDNDFHHSIARRSVVAEVTFGA